MARRKSRAEPLAAALTPSAEAALKAAAQELLEPEQAAADLLAVWVEARTRELAELIEALAGPCPAVAALSKAGTTTEVCEAVAALEREPADPRIASALAAMVEKPRYTSQSVKTMWAAVFRLLAGQHADPRTAARLGPLAAHYPFLFGATMMGAWMQGQLRELADGLAERFAPCPPLSPEQAELVARLHASVVGAKLLPRAERAAPTEAC